MRRVQCRRRAVRQRHSSPLILTSTPRSHTPRHLHLCPMTQSPPARSVPPSSPPSSHAPPSAILPPPDPLSSPFTVWPCPLSSPPSALPSLLSPAVSALRAGGVVAIPTETVYGLAGSALDDSACRRIFAAKGRPSDNPLIVHCPSTASLSSLCLPLSAAQRVLADTFWPGPLTLLLTLRPDVRLSALVTAGHPQVAVRVPAHPIALALLSLCGLPLAAPSANVSGRPSPTSALHVQRDLGEGRGVSGVVDSGDSGVGVESSVVQVVEGEGVGSRVRLRILRPGAVTREQLQTALPRAVVEEGGGDEGSPSASSAPLAPGMKYAHYQPRAPFVLLEGSLRWRVRVVRAEVEKGEGGVGVLCRGEEAEQWRALRAELADSALSVWATPAGVEGVAHDLFRALRSLDDSGVRLILAGVVEEVGMGEAVMNRMTKAAAQHRWTESPTAHTTTTHPTTLDLHTHTPLERP